MKVKKKESESDCKTNKSERMQAKEGGKEERLDFLNNIFSFLLQIFDESETFVNQAIGKASKEKKVMFLVKFGKAVKLNTDCLRIIVKNQQDVRR